MRIDHIAIWTGDIDRLKDFYVRYFDAAAGDYYHNPVKSLTTCFLTFSGGGARLELMTVPDLRNRPDRYTPTGYAHIAVSVGSREAVAALTATLRLHGVRIVGSPRVTGDGYYESVIADPDGNLVEITV